MIWLPERLLGLVRSVEISPFLRSDHQCAYLSILLPMGTQRGPGLWKFDASLLNNVAFCDGVQEFWTAWRLKRSSFSYLSNWYEAGKVQLRTFVREFSRSLASDQQRRFNELSSQLADLQQHVDSGDQCSSPLERTRAELDSYLLNQARGAQLRAQTREAIEGERSTSYFLRKEIVRGQQRLIHAMTRPVGSLATTKDDILHVWRDFYFYLFSSQHLVEDHQHLFLDPIERRLSAAESRLCEGHLTLAECSTALSSMPAAKSPGIDGFPAEFMGSSGTF